MYLNSSRMSLTQKTLGRGHKPNNPVARKLRRERVLNYLITTLEKKDITEESKSRILIEIRNLKDKLSGARWTRLKEERLTPKAAVSKQEEKDSYKNEVIDCYTLVPRYMSKKKKKNARRSSSKATTNEGGIQKGWIKIFSISISNRHGVMALLKSGKHPNFRFDPSNPKDRKVFATRNTIEVPNPVKKG